jgi:signal recognition particle GTPase
LLILERGRCQREELIQTRYSVLERVLDVFQVGAALSMVYVSGVPVMFVGCGQTYTDLKKLNVKSIVKSLLV